MVLMESPQPDVLIVFFFLTEMWPCISNLLANVAKDQSLSLVLLVYFYIQ